MREIVRITEKKTKEELVRRAFENARNKNRNAAKAKIRKAAIRYSGKAVSKIPVLGTVLGVTLIADKAHSASMTNNQEEKNRLYLEIAEDIWSMTPPSIMTDIAKVFFEGLLNNVKNELGDKAAVVQPSFRKATTDAKMTGMFENKKKMIIDDN